MLSARDQENLVHGHQAAAASKPLNQGARQFAPKTPGNKVPNFKLPLNDENAAVVFAGGKTGFKTNGKANENLMTGGKKGVLADKNALVTPLGPRTRAPLGLKTTNAKAKIFQTPRADTGNDNDFDNLTQKSAAGRKVKPISPHVGITRLDILGDNDELEEREIEYMPPRPKDLPDPPDDLPELDFSMFKNGGLTRGCFDYYMNRPDEEGLSLAQREEQDRQKLLETIDMKYEAMMLRDIESSPVPCVHYPECPGEECKSTVANRKKAEEQYRKTMAVLCGKSLPAQKKPLVTKGPSTFSSKTAASALSQQKPLAKPKSTALAPALKSKLPSSLISGRKKTPPPTNPSPMRHTAAAVASRTTMGYSKGRATSANLRKTILPKKDGQSTRTPAAADTTLAPAVYIQRYGVPPLGSEMWVRCKSYGCFDEDDGKLGDIFSQESPVDYFREEAEQDFHFTC